MKCEFDDDGTIIKAWCEICEKEVNYLDGDYLHLTHDCHGIPFRHVCDDCYEKIMERGYDGEYYSEYDENIYDEY